MFEDIHDKIQELDHLIISQMGNRDSEFVQKVSYDWNNFKISFDFAWDWYKLEKEDE